MIDRKKSANLLPEFIRSEKNKKFLSSVLDPLISTPELERVDGYIGSKNFTSYDPVNDFYIKSFSKIRSDYSLEPALILKDSTDNINDVISYDDIINQLSVYGLDVSNLDKVFRTEFYSFNPPIDWDKIVNYDQYYWLVEGPPSIAINNLYINVFTQIIGQSNFVYSAPPISFSFSNGMKVVFAYSQTLGSNTIQAGVEYIVEGVGRSIRLVKFLDLQCYEPFLVKSSETFDSTTFDDSGFDSDQYFPFIPEYITISRGSKDLNPWTRSNRWFHKNVIEKSYEINNQVAIFDSNFRSKRPIVEFNADLQLYNFGVNGLPAVDLIDEIATDLYSDIQDSPGYYIDGIELQPGHRVIFNNDADPDVRGKIYQVSLNKDSEGTERIFLTLVYSPVNNDSINLKDGLKYKGTSWYFDSTTLEWKYAQQHFKINDFPLFDLFNNAGISYRNIATNTFKGSKIFNYDIGTGKPDNILGFPTKSRNSVGIGSFVFKNFFMTDSISVIENNISREVPISSTYFKINGDTVSYANIWYKGSDYQIPHSEFQVIQSSTSTVDVNSLTFPFSTATTKIISYINNVKSVSTATFGNKIKLNFGKNLSPNDIVVLKITSTQLPNEHGAYDTPLSLSNNPLNGPISDMTLSELTDHVFSMVDRLDSFVGEFPGNGNLRDISNYGRFGTKFIINSNPIVFPKIFLGKRDHNVIDSIRFAADQYNQFKNSFYNLLNSVSGKSPSDAVDEILKIINHGKDLQASFYRSDMVGYGSDKKEVIYTVNDESIEYPIYESFSLNELSFKSILVYVNNIQKLVGIDYTIDSNNESIIFLSSLTLNDVIKIVIYQNTKGCYIPSTPTKLGLFPKFEPKIIASSNFITQSAEYIQGHDGSFTYAFNDYRDDIVLELEKRIYNNIKVTYDQKLFDIFSILPGYFRETKFPRSTLNSILQKEFVRWTNNNSIDYKNNVIYNGDNPFTWNFKNGYISSNNSPVFGHWKGLYRYLFDTDRPHTHPWEILGHKIKPSWWDTHYGWDSARRGIMIAAMASGRTEEYPSTVVNPRYVRPGFSLLVPVDSSSNLISPTILFNASRDYNDRKSEWEFGDCGPAELVWRESSYFPFVLNILAALTEPCDYTSKMYDISRSSLNILNQVTYVEDDLYLNPKKLYLESKEDVQISGFGNFVYENGRRKNLDYISVLERDIKYLSFNLFNKVGGFISKDKIQISIDALDPSSLSQGSLLSSQDYQLILNVGNPIKVSSISGIIIQRLDGKFLIKGYDRDYPYFPIFKPIGTSVSNSITVGGISSAFSDWSISVNNSNKGLSSTELTTANSTTSRYYKQGQIVRYNNVFYRVKVGHNATPAFDLSLFERLPKLPIQGGVSVSIPSGYERNVTLIPYGNLFETIQEVYNFILGYGEFCKEQGFIFDQYNEELGEILDWKFSAKEFLYWATQNWSNNHVITLSPFADSLKFQYENSTVDDVSGNTYEYSLLKADGLLFPKDKFELSREDTVCYVKTMDTEEGMFYAKLYSVQKEHGIVLNNTTLFNDTIFNIETGYRQKRIKLSGFRTKNWNGDFLSPGFIFDVATISDWQQFKEYISSEVVRFNGSYFQAKTNIEPASNFNFEQWTKLSEKPIPDLLPNFDYKINQFEDFYSLDIDNFDQSQQQLAQHLIGYSPRTYLNDIFTNPISQYKFYQGYIKEKGTKNAIEKLGKAKNFYAQGSFEVKELWALRIGDFGGFAGYSEIETPLEEGSDLENPYVLKFVDSLPSILDPLINYNLSSELIQKPLNFDASRVFEIITGTFTSNSIELQTAGYVSPDDVNYTAYNKNSILDIANNQIIRKNETVWLGYLENGGWQIYRYRNQPAKVAGVYISLPGSEITFTTDKFHNLSVGDMISIVRFNEQVNGVYVVKSIPALNQFSVSSSLTTIVNQELLAFGALFKFEKARFNNFKDWANFPNLLDFVSGDKIWVDQGFQNKWEVYQKVKNYSSTSYEPVGTNLGQQLGKSIFVNDNSNIVLFGLPGWKASSIPYQGKVWVLKRNIDDSLEKVFDYSLNSPGKLYSDINKPTEIGFSLAYDIKKNLYITGAPGASYVAAPTGQEVFSTGTGTARVFDHEGVVKISTIGDNSISEKTLKVIAHPILANKPFNSHARFGHSVYINQVPASSPTTLLVGAPGDNINSGTGIVFAYQIPVITTSSSLTVTRHPSGLIFGNGTGVKSVVLTTGSITSAAGAISIGFSQPQLPYGTTATGIVVKTGNTVTSVVIVNPGTGYTSPPTVTFRTSSGTTGTASALLNKEPVTLNNGSKFGQSIVGNINGTRIAISAPDYQGSVGTGVVQIFDNNLQFVQSILSPFSELNSKFGHALAMSSSGKFLAISSIDLRISSFEAYGKVFLYKLNFQNLYEISQIISNPTSGFDLKFGHSLSFSEDENSLVISALGTNRSKFTTFDKQTKSGEAIFDGGTTRFTYPIKDSGTVIVYTNFEDNFILSEDLSDIEILEGSRFGDCVLANNNDIYVGATSLSGTGIKSVTLGTSILGIDKNDYYSVSFSPPDLGTSYPSVVPVYSNYTSNTKDLIGLQILYAGDGYKLLPTAILRDPSGAGVQSLTVTIDSDDSRVYRFSKKNKSINGFELLKSQPALVDVNKVKRVALFDNDLEEIIEYLDIYDPIKGKIHGLAEQEISYKSTFDPAVYTIGTKGTSNDPEISWIDEHVGELWWDLSTAKYLWYEQGDEIYRKNNWGKLFPGATIDVYEWVKSDILPSEWAIEADTNEGITKGISGQPKYPDNSSISIKQVFNNVTGSFENIYYFWVKNKVTVPVKSNRRISSLQVATIISDPASYGLKFAEIISPNAVALTNINNLLIDKRISLNIVLDETIIDIPRHTEWILVHEGDSSGRINSLLEKKLFDSLLGHDFAGRPVPDISLNSRNRYGLGIRPQQSLFKNRFEALRTVIDFANSVLEKNIITGNYSFTNLLTKDSIPNQINGDYDFLIEDIDIINEIDKTQLIQGKLVLYISNGKIVDGRILNSGFGYKFPPILLVPGEMFTSKISTEINDLGQIVKLNIENPEIDFDQFDIQKFVTNYRGNFSYESFYNRTLNILPLYTSNNLYTTSLGDRYGLYREPDYEGLKYWVDKSFQKNQTIDDLVFRTSFFVAASLIDNPRTLTSEKSFIEGLIVKDVRPHTTFVINDINYNKWTKHIFDYNKSQWIKVQSQGYDTQKYWSFIDWKDTSFNEFKKQSIVLDNIFDIDSLQTVAVGDYIKVKNFHNSNFAIFERIELGASTNYNINYKIVYFQNGTIRISDSLWNYGTGFDIKTLEENLYDEIPDLEIYYILLALRDNIFINNLKENWNKLFFRAIKYALTEQKMLDWAFKTSLINVFNKSLNLDQGSLYRITNEKSIEEYISEIKPYHSVLTNYRSVYNSVDDAPIFTTDFDLPPFFNTLTNKFESIKITDSQLNVFPWKAWKDNYRYKIENIQVADPGSGYTQLPTIEILGGGPTSYYDIAAGEPYIKGGGISQIELFRSGNGYTSLPKVNILGGGSFVTRNATASAILGGSPVRKNIIRLKFDRIDAGNEVGDRQVTDRFIADGNSISFESSWLIDPDKLTIRPLIDGKIILSTDYKIEYYTKKYNKYNKRFSKFVFLNYVPLKNQVIKITYNKHIDLYKAEERINLLYNPTDLMIGKESTLLMEGFEYTETRLEGLMFDYSSIWNGSPSYDNFVWSDLTDYYASAKLTQLAPNLSTFLVVNTTTGIVPGQVINILNTTSNSFFRTGTVVESVIGNVVNLKSPTYQIKKARSTSTGVGSDIIIETKVGFFGDIAEGDTALVSGIITTEFNGTYVINKILGNNKFKISALTSLSTSKALLSGASSVKILPILKDIEIQNVTLENYIFTVTNTTVTNTSSYIFLSLTKFDDVSRHVVSVDEYDIGTSVLSTASGGGLYYSITNSSVIPGRASLSFYNINTTTTTTFNISLFADPKIEFWKNNIEPRVLDSMIMGGNWIDNNFMNAKGIAPEDIIIDGDSFLSPYIGHAPEEHVKGHVADSLSINVYTKDRDSGALIISGAIPITNVGQITTGYLGLDEKAMAGIMVTFDGRRLERQNEFAFNTSTQYFIEGNTIHIAPQSKIGRAGYSIVLVGGKDLIDGNSVKMEGLYTATVYSLASINDVKSAWVTIDGEPVSLITTTTDVGYMLEPFSKLSDRAAVKLYNVYPNPGQHTIDAWFFRTPVANFNTFREQLFVVGTSTSTTFTLDPIPGVAKPTSDKVFVESSFGTGNTSDRKRLSPPWVTYYKVINGQNVFSIPNNRGWSTSLLTIDTVKVYVNGIEIRSGFDWGLDSSAQIVIITKGLLANGDVVAIEVMLECDYIIINNVLQLTQGITTSSVKVISFPSHDNMVLKTERFKTVDMFKKFTISFAPISDSYVWITVNGYYLVPRVDFEILPDGKTIQISDYFNRWNVGDEITVTYVSPPNWGSKIVGYKIFKDIFENTTYHRLSKSYSTVLAKDTIFAEKEIEVRNANSLIPPNSGKNIPGVVFIDGERIEFSSINGNKLVDLRRGTLGTGPSTLSLAGTRVIDQSLVQIIPATGLGFTDFRIVQNITATNTTTYIISTSTTDLGPGIIIKDFADPSDQVEVFYGGRKLRKTSIQVHDKTLAFDSTSSIRTSDGYISTLKTLPPEFTISTITEQVLTLNIPEIITSGTRITIVMNTGTFWQGSESVLTGISDRLRFLQLAESELPDEYYYGGEPTLLDENGNPLTDNDGNPLLGY